jgi:uncharacterized protein
MNRVLARGRANHYDVRQNNFMKRLKMLISPFASLLCSASLLLLPIQKAECASPPDARKEIPPAIPFQALPFPLQNVRLLDGPFKAAQDVNARYLLMVEPDRLLAGFRQEAGLQPKGKRYGGWEAREIHGHGLGHYLSAVSIGYAATGDARMLERVKYIVDELAACQQANTNGYVAPMPQRIYRDISAGKIEAQPFSLNDWWVPNYTLHKIFAGLGDAYHFAGNTNALAIERKLADWLDGILTGLTSAQIQQMLRTEHGGMNEVLADLAANTGDARYLDMARKYFHHDAVFAPLLRGEDKLNGLHGNTQIPKIVGLAREYELTGEPQYRTAVTTFWDTVVSNRSYVIGGHGEREHFFPPASFPQKLTAQTCETCNSYNLFRLTGHLFAWSPDAAQMDFVERALVNHVFANIGRQPGEFGYFLSLSPVAMKVFSTPDDSWWCCVGTGMENPERYGELVYFHGAVAAGVPPGGKNVESSKHVEVSNESPGGKMPPSTAGETPAATIAGSDTLWVNLFMASELDWPEQGIKLRQETRFPDDENVRFTFTCKQPVKLAVKLRHPYWCEKPVVKINGTPVPTVSNPSSYLTLERTWKNGDTLDLRLPMALRLESLPHSNDQIVAALYGPSVLAGIVPPVPGVPDPAKERYSDHLKAKLKTADLPPVLVAQKGSDLLAHLQPAGTNFAEFRSDGMLKPADLTFVPLYRVYEEHYAVYFPLLTPAEWAQREADLRVVETLRKQTEAANVDSVSPGFQQSEVDHGFKSENSSTGESASGERKWREARDGGWFSYEVKVDPDHPVSLVCTYWGSESGKRTFDILVDDAKIATQNLAGNKPDEFWDATYPIPSELTRGKQKVVIKLQAQPGNFAGGLFGCRILRGGK